MLYLTYRSLTYLGLQPVIYRSFTYLPLALPLTPPLPIAHSSIWGFSLLPIALSPIFFPHAPIAYRSSSIAHSPIWGFSLLPIALSPISFHHAPLTYHSSLSSFDWSMIALGLTHDASASHPDNGPFSF